MFRNARVNDKIWDSEDNIWLSIVAINEENTYSIELNNGNTMTFGGKDHIKRKNPRYFWQRFDFPINQTRPKQKVKKIAWLGYYPCIFKQGNGMLYCETTHLYFDKSHVQDCAISKERQILIQVEIEIEE